MDLHIDTSSDVPIRRQLTEQIIFLIATGRRRAAATAAATFVSTVAVGFALLPEDSREFWLQGRFNDVRRISSDPLANTSLRGLLLRLHWLTGWESAASIVLAILGIVIAAVAWRRVVEPMLMLRAPPRVRPLPGHSPPPCGP